MPGIVHDKRTARVHGLVKGAHGGHAGKPHAGFLRLGKEVPVSHGGHGSGRLVRNAEAVDLKIDDNVRSARNALHIAVQIKRHGNTGARNVEYRRNPSVFRLQSPVLSQKTPKGDRISLSEHKDLKHRNGIKGDHGGDKAYDIELRQTPRLLNKHLQDAMLKVAVIDQ